METNACLGLSYNGFAPDCAKRERHGGVEGLRMRGWRSGECDLEVREVSGIGGLSGSLEAVMYSHWRTHS